MVSGRDQRGFGQKPATFSNGGIRMLRISRLSDYSFILLESILRNQGRNFSASELAAMTALPLPTVAKVLKLLARGGLLKSCRGAAGGYVLGQPAETMTVAQVLTALEGPLALTACVESAVETCQAESLCPLRGRWNQVNNAVRRALESVTLADLVRDAVVAATPDAGVFPPLPQGKVA